MDTSDEWNTQRPFRISNVWRSFSLSGWPCLEGIVTWSRMDHQGVQEGAFSSPQSFSQCSSVQAWSYWVFLTLPPLCKTSTSTVEGFCICTSWSQVTKSLQSLLHLIASLWLTQLPFVFAFGNSQGLAKATNSDGASNQDKHDQPFLSCLMHWPVLAVNIA